MKMLAKILLLVILCVGGLMGCVETSKEEVSASAMIDVNAIVSSGPHAQEASNHIKKAQDIYQHNLTVIEKKLSEYKNKEQARAYLIEAARQLQVQLNNSRLLATQALLNALNTVLDEQKKSYDLIIKKDGIIYVNEGQNFKAMPEDITAKAQVLYDKTSVTFPALPQVVNEPNLPEDLGEGVPFPPVTEAAPQEKKEEAKPAPASKK